jgi:hypothetical protein
LTLLHLKVYYILYSEYSTASPEVKRARPQKPLPANHKRGLEGEVAQAGADPDGLILNWLKVETVSKLPEDDQAACYDGQ